MFNQRKNNLKYFLLLVPSAFIGSIFWTVAINGRLYYCSDSVPLLDIIPPFVHGSQYGDYYIVNEWIIWTIWILIIGFIFSAPYFFLKYRTPAK